MRLDDRKTLTKSLHTITAVARVARHLQSTNASLSDADAVRDALELLGQRVDWRKSDPTVTACVARVKQMREAIG